MSTSRPRVFIGSSAEGLPIAAAVQANLEYKCDATIWGQGVFGLGGGTLESLVEELPQFDFAILVLTADDVTLSRDDSRPSPRDNVLLELGLSIGILGRRKTFAVYDRGSQIKLPSDLAGVTLATFQTHANGNLQSSVGTATTQITEAMSRWSTQEVDDSFRRDVGGEWHSYHLSRDARRTLPYWVVGRITIRCGKDSTIDADHADIRPPRNRYTIEGHASGGSILLSERNSNPSRRDDCLAYFNNLQHKDVILGFWLGPNTDNELTVGPYILSRNELDLAELRSLARSNPILDLEVTDEIEFGPSD